MSSVDLTRLRTIVLQRMRAVWDGLAEYQRNLPTYVFQDSDTGKEFTLSPNDVIREVELMSEQGKKIIVAEATKMGQLQPR